MRVHLLLPGALALLGCNHHVFSPPARALPLQSVAPVGEGRVGVGAEGAVHGAVPFGPSASSGSGRVRVSPHQDVDVSLEGHVIHIDGAPAVEVEQEIYALRVGAKYRALQFLALTGGFGGGFHAAGTYISPDLGIIVGYENVILVPFFSLRGYVSAPLAAREIDTTSEGGDPGEEVGVPQITNGFATTLGVRVPMLPGSDPHEGIRGSLLLAPGITMLSDADSDIVMFQFGGGGEMTF